MKAVCDTCTLIRLSKGGCLSCLGVLFENVLLPTAVREECRKPETAAILAAPFFEVREVKHLLPLTGLGRGEHEAISLAAECGGAFVITDDERAVKKAMQAGCKPVRTPQILLLAKQKGCLDSVKEAMDAMRERGEGIEEEVYLTILDQAGEKR